MPSPCIAVLHINSNVVGKNLGRVLLLPLYSLGDPQKVHKACKVMPATEGWARILTRGRWTAQCMHSFDHAVSSAQTFSGSCCSIHQVSFLGIQGPRFPSLPLSLVTHSAFQSRTQMNKQEAQLDSHPPFLSCVLSYMLFLLSWAIASCHLLSLSLLGKEMLPKTALNRLGLGIHLFSDPQRVYWVFINQYEMFFK